MIQYIPPTPRRRWPGVLLMAVLLVLFMIVISACGSDHHGPAKPAPVTTTTQPTSKPIQPDVYESHTGGANWPQVRSYCDPDVNGVRIYVTNSLSAYEAGQAVAVIADPSCTGR